MWTLEKRTIVAFATGVGVAVAGTMAGASFGSQPAPRAAPAPSTQAVGIVANAAPAARAPLITSACANKKTGAIAIKTKAHKRCTRKEKAVRFAPVVKPTPSLLDSKGNLTLSSTVRLSSPNGRFTLVVTNDGLGLKGPGGTVIIDPFKVQTTNGAAKPPE